MPLAQAPILPQLVGIVNVTPDSFSDGGKFLDPQAAIKQVMSLVEEGANLVDIGAESSGLNSAAITVDEEWGRLEPVLKVVAKEITISLDTYKSEIAKRATDLGVGIINDISAMRADSNMAKVVAAANCKVVLMHSKESGQHPHVTETAKSYDDVVKDISSFLASRVQYSVDEGVPLENIILDPGLGLFISHNRSDSWTLLRRIEELHALGLPLFVGASRKSFLKTVYENSPSERDPVSALLGVHLMQSGVRYIRTHNIKLTVEFMKAWHEIYV
jgi:dihydropteroate synthase